MSDNGYDGYEDWYDNGPGSESFKREMIGSFESVPLSLEKKPISKKVKNSKNALSEQIEALDKRLKDDVKLSPYTTINKGLLEEIVKNSKRILKYVEGIENGQDIS